MEDVTFARAGLERTEDSLRGFGAFLDHFRLQVDDLQAVWIDQAGRDINDQYLQPHAAETAGMVEQIRQQLGELERVIQHMIQVGTGERKLNQCSEENEACRKRSEGEALSAHRYVDGSLNASARAFAAADEAANLLNSI